MLNKLNYSFFVRKINLRQKKLFFLKQADRWAPTRAFTLLTNEMGPSFSASLDFLPRSEREVFKDYSTGLMCSFSEL